MHVLLHAHFFKYGQDWFEENLFLSQNKDTPVFDENRGGPERLGNPPFPRTGLRHRIADQTPVRTKRSSRQVEPLAPAADSCSGEPADREFTIHAPFRSEVKRQSTHHMLIKYVPFKPAVAPPTT
ncbi:MAG TPA: hypothetical protein VKE92_01065 [Anaerolineales bacterium]|nr:hypothetical protein [Anaerolineales bacterium]